MEEQNPPLHPYLLLSYKILIIELEELHIKIHFLCRLQLIHKRQLVIDEYVTCEENYGT
jgi:hypothetical protein